MLLFCSYAFLQICQYCLLINYLNKLADVEVQHTNPKATSTKLYLDRLTKFNPQITQLINCINLYRFSADTQWQPEYYVILNICYFKTVRVAADNCPSVRCKEIAIYTYLYQTNYFQVRHITLHRIHTHTHTHKHTQTYTPNKHTNWDRIFSDYFCFFSPYHSTIAPTLFVHLSVTLHDIFVNCNWVVTRW